MNNQRPLHRDEIAPPIVGAEFLPPSEFIRYFREWAEVPRDVYYAAHYARGRVSAYPLFVQRDGKEFRLVLFRSRAAAEARDLGWQNIEWIGQCTYAVYVTP